MLREGGREDAMGILFYEIMTPFLPYLLIFMVKGVQMSAGSAGKLRSDLTNSSSIFKNKTKILLSSFLLVYSCRSSLSDYDVKVQFTKSLSKMSSRCF